MSDTSVWFDGRIVPCPTAQPTLRSFGLHYGYGVFEGLRAFEVRGKAAIFALSPHIDRLYASAEVLDIPIPYDGEFLAAAHYEVLEAIGLKEAYLRPIAFLGDGIAGLGTQEHSSHVAILAWPWQAAATIGTGARLGIASRRRPSPDSFPPHAKAAGSYMLAKLAYNEAVGRGFDDAIMLDDRGQIAEATAMNLFAVRDGALTTPTTRACLPGITRVSVIGLARDAGIQVREGDLTVSDVLDADEVFLTSTAAGLRPVVEIEGRRIGSGEPGPVTKSLTDRYGEFVLTQSR